MGHMQALNQGDNQAVGQHQERGNGIHNHAVRHDTETKEKAVFQFCIISYSLHNKILAVIKHSEVMFILLGYKKPK